ncbi:hypothetical protein [Peribacillus kribbensis]|uniref:hypothetical protein n=1 Tax=Peribacillus kribbensis TaxID=356658 RepID=UPI000413D5E9|nr:hypothetical protein [Peribacillus kribbensis]
MGLFSAISAWTTARQAKFLSSMEENGTCPDCRGRGFNPYGAHEFYYANMYECPGCNGTGLFSDWSESE